MTVFLQVLCQDDYLSSMNDGEHDEGVAGTHKRKSFIVKKPRPHDEDGEEPLPSPQNTPAIAPSIVWRLEREGKRGKDLVCLFNDFLF